MTNVSYSSENLELFMHKELNMRVFENACPSGASIGLEVYPRYKHHFLFLAHFLSYSHICFVNLSSSTEQILDRMEAGDDPLNLLPRELESESVLEIQATLHPM